MLSTIPSGGGVISLNSQRYLSDYDYLIFTVEDNYQRNPSIFPTGLFITGNYNIEIDYSTPDDIRWATFKYQSNTQIYINGTANDVRKVAVYGMKI